MMAMTPQAKMQLDELEIAFLEAVEPPRTPTKSTPMATSKPKKTGWFSGLKDRLVMKFVCCAPPQSLLDDDEINEILAAVEESTKPKALSKKEPITRRNSAMVMPLGPVSKPSLSDITHVLDGSVLVEDVPCQPKSPPTEPLDTTASHSPLKFSTVQLAVLCLSSLHKSAQARTTERLARSIQNRWRAKAKSTQPNPEAPTVPATEPDREPETTTKPATPITSPKRVRRQPRKLHGRKKAKNIVAEEVKEAVESITQLAQTRKRLRSIHLDITPGVNVERDVHVLFGEEEIDDDELDSEIEMTQLSPLKMATFGAFTIPRCVSVPPPPTALRPVAVKSKNLVQLQAVIKIQRVWRAVKAREVARQQQQFEQQKHSVMPTIRSKMADLRKRLEEIQERNSLVMYDAPLTPVDEDFDWL